MTKVSTHKKEIQKLNKYFEKTYKKLVKETAKYAKNFDEKLKEHPFDEEKFVKAREHVKELREKGELEDEERDKLSGYMRKITTILDLRDRLVDLKREAFNDVLKDISEKEDPTEIIEKQKDLVREKYKEKLEDFKKKELKAKCPECGDIFDTEKGMKIHKSRSH